MGLGSIAVSLPISVREEVSFESFDSILLLAAFDNFPIVINDEVKKINPLDSFELILDEHFPDKYLGFLGDGIFMVRNLNLDGFQLIHEFCNRV